MIRINTRKLLTIEVPVTRTRRGIVDVACRAFDAATVAGEEIRTVAEYGGVRVHPTGRLGGAVLRIQTDIGFGDAIKPAATDASYPSLLGIPAPHLRAYPRETVVAEKLEAIGTVGNDDDRGVPSVVQGKGVAVMQCDRAILKGSLGRRFPH